MATEQLLDTCLIVDDDATSRDLLVNLARSLGWQPSAVSNGEEAVARCRTDAFAFVLMDCFMPLKDGLDATREIRTFNQDIPIVAVTTANNEHDCAAAGMNYFIAKPVAKGDLRMALDFLGLSNRQP